MDKSLLEYALMYAGMGLPVHPLHTPERDGCSCGRTQCPNMGKHPRTKNGVKDAATDPGQITAWWTRWPEANIGFAAGGASKILVLDVDCNHEKGKYGDETLAALEGEHGPLPETWLCLTGGGGLHYYFTYDGEDVKNDVEFLPGLDIRTTGGYVVVPPSLHASGQRYIWEGAHEPWDTPLAPLPDWLRDLILYRGKNTYTGRKEESGPPQTVTEGGRNRTMFRLAASLRARGLMEPAILAAVWEENQARCTPPLARKEIETVCASAGKYERGPGVDKMQASAVLETVRPPDFSDAGNAFIFSREHEDDLIFVDALGWLWWTGMKWERDDHKAVAWALVLSERMLKEALQQYGEALQLQAEAKARYAETGDDGDNDAVKAADSAVSRAKAYTAHAKQTRNATRIKNMLELSKPALVIKADRLDANPFDLNTPAGIVDLRTGQLRPHDRTAYCSQMTESAPGADGVNEWGSFLDLVTCGDGGVRGFLQLVAGMSLIGAVYQEGIIIAYGGGRNGKSTLFNAVGRVLGDYTGSIDIKVITTDRANKGASLATLRGKRLVITGELEEHQRLSVATLKQLASTDRLVIEEKFKQPETVKQTHTLVLFTNHLPRVGSTDSGTWRRLIVVPFNATISPQAGVQNYADVLVNETGGAILSWAIEGAVNFIRNGFKLDVPDAVAEATEDYQEREDWLNNFISERCIREPTARVRASDLYHEYRDWAQETGDFIRRLGDFTTAMESAGFQNVRPQNKSTWIGLRIDMEAKFGSPYAASV